MSYYPGSVRWSAPFFGESRVLRKAEVFLRGRRLAVFTPSRRGRIIIRESESCSSRSEGSGGVGRSVRVYVSQRDDGTGECQTAKRVRSLIRGQDVELIKKPARRWVFNLTIIPLCFPRLLRRFLGITSSGQRRRKSGMSLKALLYVICEISQIRVKNIHAATANVQECLTIVNERLSIVKGYEST